MPLRSFLSYRNKMSVYKARIKNFEQIIMEDYMNIEKLQKLSFHGIPDEKGLRALVWKILLNYIPRAKKARPGELSRKRELYQSYISTIALLCTSPHKGEIIITPQGPECDHPLSVQADSKWNEYFIDNEVLLQIDKDVRRLCPDMNFFQSATEFPCEYIVNSNGLKRLHSRVEQTPLRFSTLKQKGVGVAMFQEEQRRPDNSSGDYTPLREGSEAHWEVVERVLFIYAKLNPGQGYVQGMNEIIGPIYHTFASDPIKEHREYAEADCFFCFMNLMSEIRDFFIRDLDKSESGINFIMHKVCRRIAEVDAPVWKRMELQDLRPQYYVFRWLTLLLSQEFPLPDVERIWDSLLSDPNRFDMLIQTCVAMVVLVRDSLLKEDFSTNVKMLQNYPLNDINLIMSKAVEISSFPTFDLSAHSSHQNSS